MTTVYRRDPLVFGGPTIWLGGEIGGDADQLDDLHRLVLKDVSELRMGESASASRCVINVRVEDPGESERDKLFSAIEAQLNAFGESRGVHWRISSREDPSDLLVIDSDDRKFSDTMHDIGARGRAEHYEANRGTFGCYFTATVGQDKQNGTKMAALAFGLAFDIERTNSSMSGFWPAQFDAGAGKDLFAYPRLLGFSAMLKHGFVDHLVLVGGDEKRYAKTAPINRAVAIRKMLITDFCIDPSRVTAVPSNSNTLGNVDIIKARSQAESDIVVSNLYHLPRAAMDLANKGVVRPMIAAEAFILLADRSLKNRLIEQLGGGPLAERCVEEIQGIADKIAGVYAPRTDAAPVEIGAKQPV